MKTKKQEDPNKLGFGRLMLWQSRSISQSANLMVVGYLSIYCTDALGLSVGLVGTLLLVSRLFDGFTDIVAGYIVDKTNTRMGRGRPYELSILGMWLCTFLMFSCPPELSTTLKCAWVLCMYAFVNSIFATFMNAGNTPYMVRAFNNQQQYIAITSYGGLATMLAVILVNISFPILMSQLATSPAGWSRLVLIYSVPLALIGILRFLFIPEKFNVDATTDKINFKHVWQVLKSNGYIYIVALIQFVMNLVGAMGVASYYYTYVVKNIALMGMVSITTMIALPSMLVLPALLKKFTIKQMIIAGFSLAAVGSLINWFAADNIPLLIAGGLVAGIGVVPANMLAGLMIIDCADYNEWKGQPRMEGTLSVIPGFAVKLASAFGAFLLGVLLQAGGYISGGVAQPDSAITMLRAIMGLIPMGFYLVAALVTMLYKLDKKMPQIRKENEERRAQAVK